MILSTRCQNWFSGILALGACWLLSGCSSREESPQTHDGLVIARDQVRFDGQPLRLPCDRAELFERLGAPSRTLDFPGALGEPAITVHVWDDRGLLAFERTDRQRIVKLSLALDEREKGLAASDADRYWPKSTYQGAIYVDGAPIDASTSPAKINAQIDAHFSPLEKFPFSWNRRAFGVSVTLVAQAKQTGLVELLVGE
jgi:hypothetical protein